jgi:hypothetical protein
VARIVTLPARWYAAWLLPGDVLMQVDAELSWFDGASMLLNSFRPISFNALSLNFIMRESNGYPVMQFCYIFWRAVMPVPLKKVAANRGIS